MSLAFIFFSGLAMLSSHLPVWSAELKKKFTLLNLGVEGCLDWKTSSKESDDA
jgi:hypothetical protein